MEKQPSFSKIIGGTESDHKEVIADAKEKSQLSGKEKYGDYIVQSTEAEKYALHLAVEHANRIAHHYGSARTVDAKRIFLLKENGVASLTQSRLTHGMCDSTSQSAAIDRDESLALIAHSAFHEALHLSSFQSAQIFNDDTYGTYRNGIGMLGRVEEVYYFAYAQEAIIATLSHRFVEQVIANDSHYEKEVERTAFIKDWMREYYRKSKGSEEQKLAKMNNIDEILIFPNSEQVHSRLKDSRTDDDYKMGFIEGYYNDGLQSNRFFRERREERELFNTVLDRVVVAGKGKIKKNELFDLFAHAHFSGKYLALARTIENVMGRGSFRELARELGVSREDELKK